MAGMRGGRKQALRNQAGSDAMSNLVTNESQPTSSSCVSESVLISLHTTEWGKKKKITLSQLRLKTQYFELS